MLEGRRTFAPFRVFTYTETKGLSFGGTWFGMRLGELTKNARIRVDIPNSLDDIWGIDITKRTATIPKNILKPAKKNG